MFDTYLNLEFHHIGVAVRQLEESIRKYRLLGYKDEDVIVVPTQKVKICFLNKLNEPRIELIESIDLDSPINNLIKKNGAGPYHTCYITYDWNFTINHLKKNKFFMINKPVESSAFNNNMICFFYNKNIGLIELVESKRRNNV